jgi:hypothetical protein
MKKFFVVAALLAAFVFASCEQSVLTGADPSANAASALRIAPQATVPPATWTPFHTLPFGGAAPAVRGLATDGTYLVAIGNTGNAVASRYDTVSDAWTPDATLTGLSAGNPGLAHYLYQFFLVTVANGASSTGSFSPDGLRWQITGNIGFGTKAAVYGPREQLYVVAGQNGEAAFTDDLSQAFTRITVATTGWPASSGNAAYINAAAYGDGTYVFGGGSGYIAYTPTILDSRGVLVPWQQAKVPVPVTADDFINAMAYGADPAFVAVGNYASGAGFILYSIDDGQTWNLADTTNAPIIGNVTIYTVTYGNGYFVAVNNAGDAAYSVDGQTWTDSTPSSVFGAGSLVNQTVYYKATNTYIAGGGDTPNGLVIAESN